MIEARRHARRSDQLPQHDDLSAAFAQQKALSFFIFRESRRCVVRWERNRRNLGQDFATSTALAHLQETRDTRLPLDPRLQLTHPEARAVAPRTQSAIGRYSVTQLLGTYDALLDDVMPPSLLVTDRGELIHSFAGASRFLRLPDGRQGLDVLDIVNSELKMVLLGGLKRALNEPSAITYKGVRAAADDRPYKVTIRRVRSKTAGTPHLVISFEEMAALAPPVRAPDTEIDLASSRATSSGRWRRAHSHQGEPAGRDRGARDQNEELQASNEGCKRPTRSCRAPTKSSRA